MAYNNKIGIILELSRLFELADSEAMAQMIDAGLESVQVLVNTRSFSLTSEENTEKLLKKIDGRLSITSVWGGWSGPAVWNFIDGPATLGLVPEAYRAVRLEDLKKSADFAQRLGVHDLATHVGFVPEQPVYQGYRELVSAVRYIAQYCAQKDLYFNFETGQETPVTLMRLFDDVGMDNLGVNLDPANLILYGRGNPIDAIDIYNGKIRGVHVKDGDYPKGDFSKLGVQKVVGTGSVNFPVFLPKLLKSGYTGDLYIEHEISGYAEDDRNADIIKTIAYIKKLMQ